MTNMSAVCEAKSDQFNAEDLLSGTRVFEIESVVIQSGQDQPVSIKLQGERKVWRPCKTACRQLVAGWGADANEYKGRSIELFRDPSVKWAGVEVGGIRVRNMSHLDDPVIVALMASKGKRTTYTVGVLTIAAPTPQHTPMTSLEAYDAMQAATTMDALQDVLKRAWGDIKDEVQRSELKATYDECKAAINWLKEEEIAA